MADDDKSRIDRMTEQAVEDYLHRSSVMFLECAINLMLTHMSKEAVAEILHTEADMIEEFD